MQNLATVATQVGILFALMAVGAVCRRTRLVDGPAVKGIVNLLIIVVTPCLIVDVFQRPFEQSMLRSFLMGFAISFAAHIALIAIARLTARGDDDYTITNHYAMAFALDTRATAYAMDGRASFDSAPPLTFGTNDAGSVPITAPGATTGADAPTWLAGRLRPCSGRMHVPDPRLRTPAHGRRPDRAGPFRQVAQASARRRLPPSRPRNGNSP